MIKIGILGDIGSGKSYVAQKFGYPIFNADNEVAKLYKQNKNIFEKLKKRLPKYIHTFPIDKKEIINAILDDKNNLKKIVKIVHTEIRKKLNNFLKKNKNKKFVILDIPLLLENKINKKEDILVYVKSKKSSILKRLKKRKNFNLRLLNEFSNIQYTSNYKKKKSHFILKNNFSKKSVNDGIKIILNEIK
jgi:dephospho-CoA kinase